MIYIIVIMIIVDMFIGRVEELRWLAERYDSPGAQLVALYGRRRVGKTELIKQFSQGKAALYHLCTKESDEQQLHTLVRRTASFWKEREPVIGTWEEYFSYLAEKVGKERMVVAIDEFPYLVESSEAVPSLFQMGWDEYLKGTGVFLILCGSSVAMMERLLGERSPLYGRRTGQIDLAPLSSAESMQFFPELPLEDRFVAYAIAGGIPQYLQELTGRGTLLERVRERIVRKESILAQEPRFLLQEELREPGTYLTILSHCVRPVRMSELSTRSGIPTSKLPIYLSTLRRLRMLERITRVGEEATSSRHTQYVLSDNFLRFWFRFLYPSLSEVEIGETEKVLKTIRRDLPTFTGGVFEDTTHEMLTLLRTQKRIDIDLSQAGKWWGVTRDGASRKVIEIDLLAPDPARHRLLAVESKWSDLDLSEARKILGELRVKLEQTGMAKGKWEPTLGLLARSIEGKEALSREGHVVFDLKDIYGPMRTS